MSKSIFPTNILFTDWYCIPFKGETSAGENNCLISAEKSTTPSNQYLRPEKLLMIDMSIKCVSPDHPQLINNMICAMQTIYTAATLAGINMNALIKTP